ncbi:MAG: CPBP family intramembrane metalloprotease [Bacteroides sp.]|nr:CPBP family intramembrane metalloprotease [Bacteroides sp.]
MDPHVPSARPDDPDAKKAPFVSAEDILQQESLLPQPPVKVWRLPAAASIITYLIAFFICTLLLIFPIGGIYGLLTGDWIFFVRKGDLSLSDSALLVERTVFLFAVLIPALVWMKYLDKYPISGIGLSLKGRGRDMVWGTLLACLLYLIAYPVILFWGQAEIAGVEWDIPALLFWLLIFFIGAFAEEIMCRGYVLRRLMYTRLNRFAALAISSAIFSLLHFLNPHTGFVPFLNLFIAGLMLGAAYLYTHNLWFPTLLHTFWNWIQGSVLGFNVSGTSGRYSLIDLKIREDNLLNGGGFGFEGSLLCTFLMLVVTGGIIWYYERKKRNKTRDGFTI